MALFGVILPSDKDVLDGYINGLREANSSFLTALIRHSSLFKQFHLFISEGDVTTRQDFWDIWLEQEKLTDRTVRVFPLEYLPASFASQPYGLFYSGDPYLSYLFELRSAFAAHAFPIVGRAHALSQDISLGAWKNLLLSPSRSYDTILCSSQASLNVVDNLLQEGKVRAEKSFAGCLELLPLGVDSCETAVSTQEARKALGLPEDSIILLCLGRLSPVDKADIHPLIHALGELCDRYGQEDCYLYICGQASADDDYVMSLVHLAGQLAVESRVLFNFDLSAEEKPLAFKSADVFVSVSDSVQESFGIAPVEAMSANVPVVLSDWDGYRELINHGEEGELVPTHWSDVDGLIAPAAFFDPGKAQLAQAQSVAVDISELAESLNRLVENKSLRSQMGGKGLQRYQLTYTPEKITEDFDDLAQTLMVASEKDKVEATGVLHSLHYGRIFKGYSSALLNDDTVLKTSLDGRQLLSGLSAPMSLNALEIVLPVQFLPALLTRCLNGETVGMVREKLELARAQADMLMLWSLKHGLLNNSVHEQISPRLVKRYQKRQSIRAAQCLKRILQRVARDQPQLKVMFDVSGTVETIKPLSDKGYGGVCRITFSDGSNIIYKPVDLRAEKRLSQMVGLLECFNHRVGYEVFHINQHILCKVDQKGAYGFRPFYSGSTVTPQSDMNRLGILSAFALLSGLSDIHSDNIMCEDNALRLLDTEMVCHPEIMNRLYREMVEEKLPEAWPESSLALTRIEVLWDELFTQGWMPEEDDIEQVVWGFREGLLLFCDKPEDWCQGIQLLSELPCRIDPVPFNSATSVIEQMEAYDIPSARSLAELKSDLLVQARRMTRHLELDSSLAKELAKSWLKGEHLVQFSQSGEETQEQIVRIAQSMSEQSFAVGGSWLSALYREWLLERSGLN
ncbi:glycosyltransferase [Sansalvadorimonas verongulae]|uniref:glycosyltransferase n=1 Tax=Sansalvadorimonas verongulae TaxID=2172824 RepID=UPI0012BB7EBA|nr:glycosyltransferase [Sansalvadorimonas verongulae]MTI15272.1 glycosyltransferase [Sansalvadorimonas verongulae]